MTYREKMMMEHPERLNNKYMGSVDGCPEDRLELKASKCDHNCIECWSREIPGTPRIEYDLSLIRKDLFAEANIIMKENNGGDMTYKERYLKGHPDEEDIDFVTDAKCPEECVDVQVPEGCDFDCERCWNSEIPDGDDIVINPSGTIAETKAAVDSLREKVGSVPVIPPVQISKILDSGERRQFKTGAVRDIQEGKGRCDLMPLDVVGRMITNPTLAFIERFKIDGDTTCLVDALTSSGVYYDAFTMFLELSKHFEEGAKKYGENNWQKGIPTHCYVDSAVRHYLKHLRGDKDEPHDRAFVWNIVCCIWTCIHKPELNEYKKKDGDSNG